MSEASSSSPDLDQLKTTVLPQGCTVLWRQRKLIVQQSPVKPTVLSIPHDQTWLIQCLERSRVTLVMFDLACGEDLLRFWASACLKAKKPLFLRIRSSPDLPFKRYPLYWCLELVLDYLGGALLLLVLSPVIIMLAALLRCTSPEPIVVRDWRVGKRGRLFQMITFRTTTLPVQGTTYQVRMSHLGDDQVGDHQATGELHIRGIGVWMHRSRLDQLPQLLNVLRGDISLIGSRAYALEDIWKMEPKSHYRLNALPGMFERRQKRSQSADLIQQSRRRSKVNEMGHL